jgi:hypothetical protein
VTWQVSVASKQELPALPCGWGEETSKAKGKRPLKENQEEKSLYKRRGANLSRGENPEDKSWSSRMGIGHRPNNPIPGKKKLILL